MSFLDKVNQSWEKGKDGTPEVQLRTGIEEVLKTAQRAEEQQRESIKSKKHEEIEK